MNLDRIFLLTFWYIQGELEELRGRIGQDGKGGDEVQQQHDLDDQADIASRYAEDNVGLAAGAEGEIGSQSHREVNEKQYWNGGKVINFKYCLSNMLSGNVLTQALTAAMLNFSRFFMSA